MKLIHSLFLLIIATIIIMLSAVPVFIIRTISKLFSYEYLHTYLKTVALGLDQLGGAILYNQEDWTVSSYTYYLARVNKMQGRYYLFMRFINLFFGKDHCFKSYEWEVNKQRDEIKAISV